MRVNERMKKLLSIVLTLCMVLSYIPAPAYAVGTDCSHHSSHNADCGYVPAVEGVPCAHAHDEACGYAEAVAEVLCACEAVDKNGAIVHTEGCGYAAPVAGSECTHTHDDACGFVAAVEGKACAYHCHICHVQELVDALPEVTAENAEAVMAQLTAIDEAKISLSEEELAQVDFTRYNSAISALNALSGQPGAEEPAPVAEGNYTLTDGNPNQIGSVYASNSGSDYGVKYKIIQSTESGMGMVSVCGHNGSTLGDDGAVTIPANVNLAGTDYIVTSIDEEAFQRASLTSISIPTSVSRIGNNAFYGTDVTCASDHRYDSGICIVCGDKLTFEISIVISGNGTVVADPTTAAEGETVTLTVTPNEGYELGRLFVFNLADTEEYITLTQGEDNTYTFTMPGADVQVNAVFAVHAHTFDESGLCACGTQAVAKIGDTYYLTLEAAAAAATEGDTLDILTDVTVNGDLAFAAFVELIAGDHTVTCTGTVTIGGEPGILFENALYVYGGDITNTGLEIRKADSHDTYYTAGAGYVIRIYRVSDQEIDLTLHNATINTEGVGVLDASEFKIFNIRYSGSNRITGSTGIRTLEFAESMTLTGTSGSTLAVTGTGEIGIEHSSGGSAIDRLTLSGGTVTASGVLAGVSATGTVTVTEGATLNATGNTAGIYGPSTVTGDVNATILTVTGDLESGMSYKFSVLGNAAVAANFTLFTGLAGNGISTAFEVPAATTLTVNEGVTVDLSEVEKANIDFTGTVVNHGTILLPADYALDDAPKSGTVQIGGRAYQWNGEKWICGQGSHTPDENIGQTCQGCFCTVCESWYGEKNDNHTFGEDYKCTLCGADCPHESYTGGYCADCGKAATYTILWSEDWCLTTKTESFTYGQDLRAEVTIPENTHLRINGVYVDDGSSAPVSYTYESGVLTILADDLPAADIWIDNNHYVYVTFNANGGTIKPEEGYPLEGDNGFAENRSYWIQEHYVHNENVGRFAENHILEVRREGWTWTGDWMDAQGNVYDDDPYVDAPLMADVTLYAQWECNHPSDKVEYRDNGSGSHDGYCTQCGDPLNNYAERPHVYVAENPGKCDLCGHVCDHSGNINSYIDDGETHSFICSVCLAEVTGQEHDYTHDPDTHTCICGLVEIFTITWIADGEVVYTTNMPYGSGIMTEHPVPEKEGHTGTWDKEVNIVTENVTVTAIYTPNQYTITFDTDGGTGVNSITLAYGSAITAPDNPAKDGFHFVKWDTLPETMPAGDLTVKAVWEAHSCGTATCEKGKVCACGAEYTAPLDHDYRWTGTAEAHWQVCARDESHVTEPCSDALYHDYMRGDGGVIEVTQRCNCGYSGEFAEVTLSGTSFTYTGKAIEPHSIVYPDSWLGEENIVPTYSGNVNATDSATMTLGQYTLTFAITKATPKTEDFVLTLPTDLTYDGQQKIITVTPAEGISGMGTITMICYHPGGDQEHSVEPIDVNEYIVSINVAEGDNYECVTNLRLGTFEIIHAAAAVKTAPTANALTYKDTAQTLVVGGTSEDGKVVYSLTENGEYTETIPTGTNAGDYTVWYYVQGDANHADTEKASVTVTIGKAELTVTAKDNIITYGDVPANAGVTYEGFVNEETDAVLGGEQTFAYDYQQFGNVGVYVIAPSGLTSGNYEITFVPGTLTVEKKAITVKADAVSKTYGEADPALTYKVEGLVNNDNLTGALVRAEGENVGAYAITQGALTAGGNYTITYTGAELTIDKRPVTITAKDQTITYGGSISSTEITAAGLVDGHSATVTLTPSTSNVTVSGTITASAAVITADGTDVTANYEIGYATGKLVIEPDTAKIDGLTTENVTSANEEDIQTVQAMMNSAETDGIDEATAEEWTAITENCEDLIEKIEAVEAENSRIADAAADFDLNTVKSSDEEAITALIADIDEQLATDNLTDEERSELEGLKTKCENLIAKIDGTENLIGQLDKKVDDLDAETVKSTDKATLEQVIADAETLINSGNVTEAEKATLEEIQKDAQDLIQVIDDTAAEKKAVTDEAAAFDADSVNSSDKAELEQLADDIDALLDTDNLTEDERKALEEVQDQVQGMIDAIEDAAEDSKAATDTIDALDPATVTSDDKEELEQAIKTIDELLAEDHLTEDERKALEDAKKDAEDLLAKIEAVQDATETENTEKVEDVTSGNVQPEDKDDLIAAKADLEKALEDNSGNYTEEEKKAIQDEIQRIEDAIEALENAEDVTDTITQLPETVEPDDEEAAEKILDAKAAYDDLTDHEKSLVDDATKKKLDDLVAALTAYDIIKGDGGKWTKGSSYGLSFTANGPFSKFVGIEVDGKEVAEKYYDAKSGSTIITLKASYLKKLSTSEHTITVLYTDGETSGTFKILAQSSTSATGDDSNIVLWGSVMGISALGIIVLLISQKRRKATK